MLEWMHDPTVVEKLKTDFASKTIEDCRAFISSAQNTSYDVHMAIVNEEDQYMGTVSLKHITGDCAEFAITIRKIAMGKGYSQFGMDQILAYGIRERGLDAIYWCVSPDNTRAVRFYDKRGYIRTEKVPERFQRLYSQELIWYVYKGFIYVQETQE